MSTRIQRWLGACLGLGAAWMAQGQPLRVPPSFFQPNDPYIREQWHLDGHDTNGVRQTIDLGVRNAWSQTLGEGVTIAIVDDGVEVDHPDLQANTAGAPHFNFQTRQANGLHPTTRLQHGTAVAGLAGAALNNGIGGAGVAPGAKLASWVVYATNKNGSASLLTGTNMAAAFAYKNQEVAVQNHSWAKEGVSYGVGLRPPSAEEQTALNEAWSLGRHGLGVVMVRGAGNTRGDLRDVNDDGYMNNPNVITVAAVRTDGRATSYSSPGAAVLVSAPSGDPNFGFPNLFTTDRVGDLGYNQFFFPNSDNANYVYRSLGFNGTSASAPEVSGIVALMLSANPALGIRDVQQILILCSRQLDGEDPDLSLNAAGFYYSHNTGFGVPDAGLAVTMAKTWPGLPLPQSVTVSRTNILSIPDAGLRVAVRKTNESPTLYYCLPSQTVFPDGGTGEFNLVDIGQATNELTTRIDGKAALIERGVVHFDEKIRYAMNAGAKMVVVFNNAGANDIQFMFETGYLPIPAVSMARNDGLALRQIVASAPNMLASISVTPTNQTFSVPNSLRCENVGLRVKSTHTSRGDLRITLRSPGGTRTVLQAFNEDATPGPVDWTYYSWKFFGEQAFGTWTAEVTDQAPNFTGAITNMELIVSGVPIDDDDHDGLDDTWELAHFGGLAQGGKDDADGDGYTNAEEQLLGSNANLAPGLSPITVSVWDDRLLRLSWFGAPGAVNHLVKASQAAGSYVTVGTVTNADIVTERFVPFKETPSAFYQLKQ